jgi:hypothetical protein
LRRTLWPIARSDTRVSCRQRYQREFLLSYPHAGPYLDQACRDHLHRIGRTHQGDLPAGTLARQLLRRLLIDLSWASSHLEGNTYS